MANRAPLGQPPTPLPVRKLGEAKAKLSEIVRLALAGQPQRITTNGSDAVVVVSSDEFDRLQAQYAATTLHGLLSQSPLNQLDFGREPIKGPVREVDI